jgi:NADPH-dependent 2,4-dienoyl-CoA reductase/sulfur reductase-like enzyme/rhodanese-related sulfurtransferase
VPHLARAVHVHTVQVVGCWRVSAYPEGYSRHPTDGDDMRVVVVGGVAGGMSAAARLRRLDESAEIVVLEKDDYVSFANCGLPYHIGGDIESRDALLLQTPKSLRESLNLDVRTDHEVLGIDRDAKTVSVRNRLTGEEYAEAYDSLVLATGASPLRPPLPGIDHPRVRTLRSIPDMDRIIEILDGHVHSAVVVGGGYIGIEMVEALRHRGLDVTLVEAQEQVMMVLDREMARHLEDHMAAHGVRVMLSARVTGFEDVDGRVAVDVDGLRLETDLVILAVGVRPETALARAAGLDLSDRGAVITDEQMRTSDPSIFAVGDMVQVIDTVTGEPVVVPLAGPANRQGRIAADVISGRKSSYSSTQGTGIVKVFELTAGMTGVTERTLSRLGRPYLKVHVHPNGHASYYPGTHAMHLKVLFDPEDGRILGAQAVGVDGVDKRIDVLAVAIRAGMTIEDLEHLELAYAPPYGSAKDPVNMAGFLGSNLLRGDVALWYAEEWPDLPADAVILDVRSRHENASWSIPGSTLIPLKELRERLGELRADAEVYAYCRSGFRSYLAQRILVQSGWPTARTLAGGELTFRSIHPDGTAGQVQYPVVPYAEDDLAKGRPTRTS